MSYRPSYCLYLAHSKSRRAVKVGITSRPQRRQNELRRNRYGGIGDWQILYYVPVKDPLQVQNAVLYRLRQDDVAELQMEFIRSCENAQEIAPCSFDEAYDALTHLVSDEARTGEWWAPHWRKYWFG